jgi:ketosteroid isomerase-like protein
VSRENLTIFERELEAYRQGDLDTVMDTLDADVVFRPLDDWPESGVTHGREATRRLYESLADALGTDIEVQELFDGGDRLIARFCLHARGGRSDLEGEFRWTQVITMRDGKAVLIEAFRDHEEALEAVGLRE